MKKYVCIIALIFIALCICTAVFQIKNPPAPAVESSYTDRKASILLYMHANDRVTGSALTDSEASSDETTDNAPEMKVNGIMVERATDGGTYEYHYMDTDGWYEYARSTWSEHFSYNTQASDVSFDDISTEGFEIPKKTDFDTPQGDEIKVYLNTSRGTRLLGMTNAEFSGSVYEKYLFEMTSVYEQVKNNQTQTIGE